VNLHLAVSVIHGLAHLADGVIPGPLDAAFIVGVITVAPILAAALLWQKKGFPGALLLALSMAGALVFGLVQHFLLPGPDNVAQQGTGLWPLVFQITALLLVPLEGLGCWLGLRLIAVAQGNRRLHGRSALLT
jgi:hypothetical protein